jgi:uncharacterized membrane protein
MLKQEFLVQLRKGLSCLPKQDLEERLTFYSEMIDDRMEEGLSEEDAVMAVGSIADIIAQITDDTPKKNKKRRLSAGEIVLLVLGSPIWVSLLIAAFAVVLSLYISLWAIIVSLWAAFGSFVACAFGGVFAGILFIAGGNVLSGIAMVGAGTACAGLGIFLFFGCKAATKYTVSLAKKCILGACNRFRRKEAA